MGWSQPPLCKGLDGKNGSVQEEMVYLMLETVSARYPTVSAADGGATTGPSRNGIGAPCTWEDSGEAAWDAEGWCAYRVACPLLR